MRASVCDQEEILLGEFQKCEDPSAALERLKQWLEGKEERKSPRHRKRCVWTFNRELIALDREDVYYLETYQRKTYVHTKDQSYRISTTLKEEEKRLGDCGFIRIHQGYLVHKTHIRRLEDHQIFLDNGQALPVSLRKEKELSSRLRDCFVMQSQTKRN